MIALEYSVDFYWTPIPGFFFFFLQAQVIPYYLKNGFFNAGDVLETWKVQSYENRIRGGHCF